MKISPWLLTITGMMMLATVALAQETPDPPPSEATGKSVPVPGEKARPTDPFAASLRGKKDPFAGEIPKPAPRWDGPKNLITVNLLGAGFGNFQLEYQRVVTAHLALVLTPSFRRVTTEVTPDLTSTVEARGILVGAAFYFPQRTPAGFNIAVSVGPMQLKLADQHQDSKTTLNAKATIGFRYLFKFGPSLEINLGALLMPETDLMEDTHRIIVFVNGGPVAELGLGWAF